jgi:TolA-binding protein
LACSLYNINDYKQAELYFERLLSDTENNIDNAENLRKYALVLAGNGKNSLASQIWQRYSLAADGNEKSK